MVLYTIALVVHAIICVALVLVILAQTSKGGGLDASLGGAAMSVFGTSGASKFLRKWTQILGLLFLASCVFLAFQVKAIGKPTTPKALQGTFGETQKSSAKTSNTAKTAKPAQKTSK